MKPGAPTVEEDPDKSEGDIIVGGASSGGTIYTVPDGTYTSQSDLDAVDDDLKITMPRTDDPGQSVDMTSLPDGMYIIYIVDEIGALSDPVSYQWISPVQITTLAPDSIGTTNLTLSGLCNKATEECGVFYRPVGSGDGFQKVVSASGFSVELTGLAPGTEYEYYVYAKLPVSSEPGPTTDIDPEDSRWYHSGAVMTVNTRPVSQSGASLTVALTKDATVADTGVTVTMELGSVIVIPIQPAGTASASLQKNADGEYALLSAASVELHVKKFSTYAIGYTPNITPDPSQGGTPSPTTFRLTATAGQGGAVSPAFANVLKNGIFTFSFAADEGYALSGLRMDGAAVPLPEGNSYTFTLVSANHTLEGVFAPLDDESEGMEDSDTGHLCAPYTDIKSHWGRCAVFL